MRWLSALDSSSTRLGITIMLSDAKRPGKTSLSNDFLGAPQTKEVVLDWNPIYHFKRIVSDMEATNLSRFHPALFFHKASHFMWKGWWNKQIKSRRGVKLSKRVRTIPLTSSAPLTISGLGTPTSHKD